MSILRHAMEENEEEEARVVTTAEEVKEDAELDTSVTDTTEAVAELETAVAEVSEGESILDSTTEIADTIEEKVESGEGVDETASAITGAALEHFYNRVNYKPTKLTGLKLESFSNSNTKLASSKLVLEELTNFNNRLSNGLTVAQEGIGARFANSVKLIFNSREKIHAKLIAVTKKINEKGAKTETINEPGWGRSFSVIGKDKLTSADVLSYVTKYSNALTSTELETVMKEYIKIVDKLADSVSKSTFIANDIAVADINALTEKIDEFKDTVYNFNTKHNVKTAENDPSFEPLDVKAADKLSKLAISLIEDNKVNLLLSAMQYSVNRANINLFSASSTRLIGSFAKDIRAARNMILKLNPVMKEILSATAERNRVAYASMNYIKASTK